MNKYIYITLLTFLTFSCNQKKSTTNIITNGLWKGIGYTNFDGNKTQKGPVIWDLYFDDNKVYDLDYPYSMSLASDFQIKNDSFRTEAQSNTVWKITFNSNNEKMNLANHHVINQVESLDTIFFEKQTYSKKTINSLLKKGFNYTYLHNNTWTFDKHSTEDYGLWLIDSTEYSPIMNLNNNIEIEYLDRNKITLKKDTFEVDIFSNNFLRLNKTVNNKTVNLDYRIDN